MESSVNNYLCVFPVIYKHQGVFVQLLARCLSVCLSRFISSSHISPAALTVS